MVIPTASKPRLAGQAPMPPSVSGVTAPPNEIPVMTKVIRASGSGMRTGRPAMAAIETARIAPDSQPAGNPGRPSAAPPILPMTSVSMTRRKTAASSSRRIFGKVARLLLDRAKKWIWRRGGVTYLMLIEQPAIRG
jgi:hypothetical protein